MGTQPPLQAEGKGLMGGPWGFPPPDHNQGGAEPRDLSRFSQDTWRGPNWIRCMS